VKQNLLDKGSGLTLNAVTAELLSVSDRIKRERQLDESEKKQKADQLALFAKSSSNTDNPGKSKNMKKGKFKPKWKSTGSICHTCGEKRYWSPKCPKKGEDKECTKPGGSAYIAIESSGNREIGKMLMALSTCCEIGQADMASIAGATDGILLDCATTSHMFSERHLFSSYQPLTNNEYVTVGGRNCVPVAGIGSVTLTMILSNGPSKLTLTNTLHILTLGTDLISLGVLHCKGALVQSWEKGLMISKNKEDLFTAVLGKSTGMLYQVQYVDASNGSAFVAETTSSMCLWHCQMGHLSPRVIDLMLCNQVVNRLKIGDPKDFDHLCNGCANRKSHWLSMPGTSTSQYSKMELLVIDLTGPMSVPTWDGFLYALVVVEVSCHYAVGHLLRDKNETEPTVRNIVTMLERQSGLKARRLRNDNGTKFINTTMSQFC